MKQIAGVILMLIYAASVLPAQAPGAAVLTPNLVNQLERPLRCRPEGTDFVIENGTEFFNRPLYGGNTAFGVDAGDRPEFLLYLPGRGGNLRLGIRTGPSAKWLQAADRIVARYRPGGMIHEVADPMLGRDTLLRLESYALSETEGLIVRAELIPPKAGPARPAARTRLIWSKSTAKKMPLRRARICPKQEAR